MKTELKLRKAKRIAQKDESIRLKTPFQILDIIRLSVIMVRNDDA